MPGSRSHWSSCTLTGSSRMRCLAAAANDLGGGKHAWPRRWPTETTQWSESLRRTRCSGDAVYLGYRAMWACLVGTADFVQRFSHRSVHVRYKPSESYRSKSLNHPRPQTTQPDRQLALEPRPRSPLDLHSGPWQVDRVGSVNNIIQSGIAL